ncbi:MAG: sigma-70 family RNA polymerase sigma factor [Oscillospiraceae bacterium]|nr:sigma-70 family RNA polymerase sigma factor [Oscillospiraceae bacterium]
MQDTDILALLWERSERAIEALTVKFGNRLRLTAMNILGNVEDAEEAVNDTYLALWNAIPPERPEPLAGYVYRTGRNIALKKLRFQSAQKRRAQYTVSLDELSSILPGNTLEDTLDARTLGYAIDRFLSTLSTANRRIFLRRYWFGDSIQDLARQERLTTNALTARLSRLRSQLKDYLYKEGIIHEL